MTRSFAWQLVVRPWWLLTVVCRPWHCRPSWLSWYVDLAISRGWWMTACRERYIFGGLHTANAAIPMQPPCPNRHSLQGRQATLAECEREASKVLREASKVSREANKVSREASKAPRFSKGSKAGIVSEGGKRSIIQGRQAKAYESAREASKAGRICKGGKQSMQGRQAKLAESAREANKVNKGGKQSR